MITLDLSENVGWTNQRDNKYKPNDACRPSSFIHSAKILKIKMPVVEGEQEEDTFFKYLDTEGVHDLYKKLYPTVEETGLPVNEYAPMCTLAFNNWIGTPNLAVCKFSSTISNMIFEIVVKHKPVIFSGLWPYTSVVSGKDMEISHVATLVGIVYKNIDLKHVASPDKIKHTDIEYMIVDDPYGDYKTRYKNKSGNNIEMPLQDFINISKTVKSPINKWAITFDGYKPVEKTV